MKNLFSPILFFLIFIFTCFLFSCKTPEPEWKKKGFESKEKFTNYLSDSISFFSLSLLERATLKDENFKTFINSLNFENEFMGFDGSWYDCNHSYHNYKEFNFNANKIVKINFVKIDSILYYNLFYVHKDIREVWGQSTTIKKILSSGTLKFVDLNKDLKFKLLDNSLNELIYISFNINKFNLPKLEIVFDCKSCKENESLLLYRASEIKKRVVGHRLHLWDDLIFN